MTRKTKLIDLKEEALIVHKRVSFLKFVKKELAIAANMAAAHGQGVVNNEVLINFLCEQSNMSREELEETALFFNESVLDNCGVFNYTPPKPPKRTQPKK